MKGIVPRAIAILLKMIDSQNIFSLTAKQHSNIPDTIAQFLIFTYLSALQKGKKLLNLRIVANWMLWTTVLLILFPVLIQYFSIVALILPSVTMFDYSSPQPLPHQQSFIHQFQTNSKICSQYIKMATERLYADEAKRISEANDLLEKLSARERVKDLSEWDVFTTRDSVMLEDLSISNSHNLSINLNNISMDSKSKIITRRNALGSRTSRDFDGSIADAIVEIERTCSPKCATLVRKLLEDYKKLKAKAAETEKKEKASKLKEKLIEELQEKNIMLVQKLEEFEFQIQKFRNQNFALKAENRQLNAVIFHQINEINSEKKIKLYQQIAQTRTSNSNNQNPYCGNIEILAMVTQERQALINLRYESIRELQAKVEELLFNEQNSCHDCCSILRKLKSSIFSYKHYLQKEGQQFDALFDAFKQKIGQQQAQNQY